jgi:hypothetical protein
LMIESLAVIVVAWSLMIESLPTIVVSCSVHCTAVRCLRVRTELRSAQAPQRQFHVLLHVRRTYCHNHMCASCTFAQQHAYAIPTASSFPALRCPCYGRPCIAVMQAAALSVFMWKSYVIYRCHTRLKSSTCVDAPGARCAFQSLSVSVSLNTSLFVMPCQCLSLCLPLFLSSHTRTCTHYVMRSITGGTPEEASRLFFPVRPLLHLGFLLHPHYGHHRGTRSVCPMQYIDHTTANARCMHAHPHVCSMAAKARFWRMHLHP